MDKQNDIIIKANEKKLKRLEQARRIMQKEKKKDD